MEIGEVPRQQSAEDSHGVGPGRGAYIFGSGYNSRVGLHAFSVRGVENNVKNHSVQWRFKNKPFIFKHTLLTTAGPTYFPWTSAGCQIHFGDGRRHVCNLQLHQCIALFVAVIYQNTQQ